jgi:serine/threonine protein kinase
VGKGADLNYSIHSDTDDTLQSEPPNPTERRLSLDNRVDSNAFVRFGRRNVEELRKTLERDQDFGGLGDELKDPSIVQEENEDDGRRSVFAKTTTSVLIRVRIKGQWFASKVCLFWDRTQQKELYKKELENLKKLRGKSHWHVVLLICHYTKPDGEGCLVLSPLAQCNLAQYLLQTPSVSKKRVVARSFGCLGSGLAHIHKMHLKHRDIKPENILIHGDNVIIADMGISGLVPDPSQTLSHSSGSRMYMPPELFEVKAHGRRQDVWSLSCCYIVMLAFLKEIPLPEFQKQHKLGCFYYSYDLVVEWLKTVPLASKDDEERALATVLLDSFKKDEDDRPYAQQLVDKIREIQSSQPYKYIGECCSQVNIPPTAHKSLAPFPREVGVHEKGSLIDFLVNAGCHILRTTKSLEVQESLWELHERAKRQEITSIRSAERKLLMIIAPVSQRMQHRTCYPC